MRVGFLFFIGILIIPSLSFAWGKRGHEIVSTVAAEILAQKKGDKFLIPHEFDMGYYANVPDLIWRNNSSSISKAEAPQHFLDWTDTLIKVFGKPENLPVDFNDYKKKMGSGYNREQGLVPWRIHQLVENCNQLRTQMKPAGEDKSEVKTLQALQGKLLVCLGTMSHYTGDIAQPLHTTDNYDGNLSVPPQTGIHVYFESDVVDALGPQLKVEVLKKALSDFDALSKKGFNSDEAVRYLFADSYGEITDLLKKDRGLNRHDLTEAKKRYASLVEERLTKGAIVTALIWNEILGDVSKIWNEDHFYFYNGKPDYVYPDYEGKK